MRTANTLTRSSRHRRVGKENENENQTTSTRRTRRTASTSEYDIQYHWNI